MGLEGSRIQKKKADRREPAGVSAMPPRRNMITRRRWFSHWTTNYPTKGCRAAAGFRLGQVAETRRVESAGLGDAVRCELLGPDQTLWRTYLTTLWLFSSLCP
jgi:hypothetical protein